MSVLIAFLLVSFGIPLLALTIVGIAKSHKPTNKTLSIIACVVVSVILLSAGMAVSEMEEAENESERPEEKVTLEFLDDFSKYGYSSEEIKDMREILTNVGITEITDLEIGNVVSGMQTVKGLAYKDKSFLADANDEVRVTFIIENGKIFLVAIYCPSYYSENKPTYLSGLVNRRADLYYDVEGGYLKKIDWENKAVVDY